MGPLHNYCHSRAGGNPGGGANGNLTAKQSLESADIELCKDPSMGEGQGEGERGGWVVRASHMTENQVVTGLIFPSIREPGESA